MPPWREVFVQLAISHLSTQQRPLAVNRYTVDQPLVSWRVELRFDPEYLTPLEAYGQGHPAGQAITLNCSTLDGAFAGPLWPG